MGVGTLRKTLMTTRKTQGMTHSSTNESTEKAVAKLCRALNSTWIKDHKSTLEYAALTNKTSTLSKILVPKKKELPEPMNVLKDETTGVLRYAVNNKERLIATKQNEELTMHMSATEDNVPFVKIKNDDIGPCGATI